MLQVNNIEVKYMNVIQVLNGVSLEVGDGHIVTLLGANGAGKSTIMKAISGMLKTEDGQITSGSIIFNGKRLNECDFVDIAKMGVTHVIEGHRVLQHLSVEDNLQVFAYNRKDRRQIQEDIDLVFNYFPKIKKLRRQMSGYLSGGEQQMLVIGRALIARPKLMLLDEPSLGLAPLLVQEIYEILKRINFEQKMTILLVEQNAQAALSVANYGYVIENGRVALSGLAEKLLNNHDIQEFYMGVSTVGTLRSFREMKHYQRKKRWLSQHNFGNKQ